MVEAFASHVVPQQDSALPRFLKRSQQACVYERVWPGANKALLTKAGSAPDLRCSVIASGWITRGSAGRTAVACHVPPPPPRVLGRQSRRRGGARVLRATKRVCPAQQPSDPGHAAWRRWASAAFSVKWVTVRGQVSQSRREDEVMNACKTLATGHALERRLLPPLLFLLLLLANTQD